MSDIRNLFAGAQRCARLLDALESVIKEKAVGMPMPSIIGCLVLMKDIVKDMPHHE